MKRYGAVLFVIATALTGCRQLWEQPSVHPYEEPQLEPTSGTVAVDWPAPLPSPLRDPLAMTSQTIADGRFAYRRYCWQCHGPKLDGNATVGPSLPGANLSLLTSSSMALSDDAFFRAIWYGTQKKSASSTTTAAALWTPPEPAVSPPLRNTMTTTETWQVLTYVRAVQKGIEIPTGQSP